ncbi:MAG: crotonase/enoyl-CoA hydratase family protein [Myxococcota bacterium]|nr:crotonase/enoyl-CoA hydratase family protein [Myxococcota bacterium]
MSYEFFEVETKDQIASVRMVRPKRFNTLDADFWRELPQIVRTLDRTGETRAIVLSSTGRHFSAGLDLEMLASMGGDESPGGEGDARAGVRRRVLQLQSAFNALESARAPVIAVVQGGCIGGGLDMVAACDIRYATANAFFCIGEINFGLTADLGTLQRLPKLVPQGVVRELAFTGRRLSAERAREVGLVNEVLPGPEEALEAAMETAREIAAHAPAAVWGSKEAVNYARDHTVPESLEQIATWQAGMFRPEDVREALLARRKRRAPRYEDLPPLPDPV